MQYHVGSNQFSPTLGYKESVNPRPQPSLGNPSKALWAHCHLGRDGIFQEWPQQNIQNTLVFVLLTWKDSCNRQKYWNFCKEIATSTDLWESQECVENLQAVLGIHEVTSWKLDTGGCIDGHAALIHCKIRSRNIENHTFQLKIAWNIAESTRLSNRDYISWWWFPLCKTFKL